MTLLIVGIALWWAGHFFKRLLPGVRQRMGERGNPRRRDARGGLGGGVWRDRGDPHLARVLPVPGMIASLSQSTHSACNAASSSPATISPQVAPGRGVAAGSSVAGTATASRSGGLEPRLTP